MAKKEKELLVRQKMTVPEINAITDESFVKEAKRLLGYKVLDIAWSIKKISEVFVKLGIDPFDNEAVEAYKKEKEDSVYKRSARDNGWGNTTVTITRGKWASTALDGYSKEVPAFALLRAAEVKKALNKAGISSTFEVEELKVTTTRKKIVRDEDPFMVLVAAGRRFYLDVWDEPKFEGRRVK